jgi:quercetin dioxygenase-like cupin family protein
MRKLVEKQLQAKPSDVINVTEQFFPELLDIETLIQEAKNAEQIHPYTKKAFGGWKSIPLRSAGGKIGVDGSSATGENLSSDATRFSDTDIMQPYIRKLVNIVAGNDAQLLKVRLMQLDAHRVIAEHVDKFDGTKAALVRRFHIPIISNPKISFYVNRKRYYLQPGQLYHIDVSQPHSVENNSDIARVHLVFDVLANETVCKKLINAQN